MMNPFAWFRVLRHLSMVGPELRRLNRNVEAFLRANDIPAPLTDAQAREVQRSSEPPLQALPHDPTREWISEVSQRLRAGEDIDPEEVRQAAERAIELEEGYDDE